LIPFIRLSPPRALVASKSPKPKVDLSCTLRVFPKTSDTENAKLKSSNATKELLMGLKLTGVNIGVKAIKTIGNNGVSVLCRDQSEVNKLKDAIKAQCDSDLEANTPKKRNPTFSILLPG